MTHRAALKRIGFASRAEWLHKAGISDGLATQIVQGDKRLSDRVRSRLAEVARIPEADVLTMLVHCTRAYGSES